jgi:hypothetical protein
MLEMPKNAAFWNIKIQLRPNRKHNTSPDRVKQLEVITVVTKKNNAFCDIITQFVFQRRLITSPLQSPTG